MNKLTRRQFSMTSGALLAMGSMPALAIEPFKRAHPYITGLSLTSYSMKPYMKWWWGKETDRKIDILNFLEYCARVGLDGAELTSYFFPEPLTDDYCREVRRRAHLLGLDITAGAMGNNFAFEPGSDKAKSQMQYTKKWIDRFADMGAPIIRVFASKSVPQGFSEEKVISNIIINLNEALEYAGKKGVMLGMENHDYVKDIDRFMKIINKIDSKWFGVIWDSANLAPTPDPYKELERIAPYAATAQIKTVVKVNGKKVPADFDRVLKILKAADYSGKITLEYEEEEDPKSAIPRYLGILRSAIKRVGYELPTR